jgi:hypothetical protein
MISKKILLPYEFTSFNRKALDFVGRTFGKQPEIHVTLFHAYTPLPEIDISANPEMLKLRSPITSLARELKEKEAGLHAVMKELGAMGFHGNQMDCVFQKKAKTVSDAIVHMTKKGNYQIIVLTRTPFKVLRLFGRSVSGKVITALEDVTICLVL